MKGKRINERIKKYDIIEKDKLLDVFRFLYVTLKHVREYNFVEYKVDGFVQEYWRLKKIQKALKLYFA